MPRLFEIQPCGDPFNKHGWEIREYQDSYDEINPIFRGDLSPSQGRDRTIAMLRQRFPGCTVRYDRPQRTDTWLMGESVQTDYGQFKRKGYVFHERTGKRIKVRADIADTYFSIPAITRTEHGFITMKDGRHQFTPDREQKTVKVYLKEYRANYK